MEADLWQGFIVVEQKKKSYKLICKYSKVCVSDTGSVNFTFVSPHIFKLSYMVNGTLKQRSHIYEIGSPEKKYISVCAVVFFLRKMMTFIPEAIMLHLTFRIMLLRILEIISEINLYMKRKSKQDILQTFTVFLRAKGKKNQHIRNFHHMLLQDYRSFRTRCCWICVLHSERQGKEGTGREKH